MRTKTQRKTIAKYIETFFDTTTFIEYSKSRHETIACYVASSIHYELKPGEAPQNLIKSQYNKEYVADEIVKAAKTNNAGTQKSLFNNVHGWIEEYLFNSNETRD